MADELQLLRAELARRELARRNYRDYLAYTHQPHWTDTRMATYIADRVQTFIESDTGHAYDILVIETPPQHGKSMTVTETLPSWYLGKFPNNRVIEASYNEEFAEKFCRRNKEKLKKYGANLFGIQIGDVDRITEFTIAGHQGRMISRGIRSGITGNPANLIIIDDPVKNREDADSETFRNKVWEEWQNSLKSRLAAGAKVILIMTPWHEDDLAARILKSEHNVELLRLPVEAEQDDPLGRKPGEALCPELGKDDKWLQDFKPSYILDPLGGHRSWEALYMCSPRVEGGNLIKRSWWKYFDEKDQDLKFATQLISVDAAFKKSDTSDFVAITVWAKRFSHYYCLYCLNRQMDFVETVKAIQGIKAMFPQATRVLIEDKANGSAISNVLSRSMFVIPVVPRGGKVARLNSVSPAIESGHVWLPKDTAWTEDFIDQFSAFPAGKHDDMVDSATQALSFMLFTTGELDIQSPAQIESETRRKEEQDYFLDGAQFYNVYGLDTAHMSGSAF